MQSTPLAGAGPRCGSAAAHPPSHRRSLAPSTARRHAAAGGSRDASGEAVSGGGLHCRVLRPVNVPALDRALLRGRQLLQIPDFALPDDLDAARPDVARKAGEREAEFVHARNAQAALAQTVRAGEQAQLQARRRVREKFFDGDRPRAARRQCFVARHAG